ncbi:MAG TPA: hypothetical protein VKX46_04055 [Ktedonobacteraceae bacterium]|nr:hypothetical protein [Ktedonobacteraceae bacterium]
MREKPTLLQLREIYGLTTVTLADAADVLPDVVYAMLVGNPVDLADAQKVVDGLNRLTGKGYALGDLKVNVKEDSV